MPKLLILLLALCGVSTAAIAQDAPSKFGGARTDGKPGFVPTEPSAAMPEANSPSVLQRLFGSRRGQQTYSPPAPPPEAAPPTPRPVVKGKTSVKKPTTGTAATAKQRKPKAKVAAESAEPAIAKADVPETVAPPVEKPEPATPAPKKTRKGKAPVVVKTAEVMEPPADADPETKEKFRFDQAKAKASEDPEVLELKAKADGAVSDEDARSAQRAYNKALFAAMRKIDGGLEDRINQMETAILKRLDEK